MHDVVPNSSCFSDNSIFKVKIGGGGGVQWYFTMVNKELFFFNKFCIVFSLHFDFKSCLKTVICYVFEV